MNNIFKYINIVLGILLITFHIFFGLYTASVIVDGISRNIDWNRDFYAAFLLTGIFIIPLIISALKVQLKNDFSALLIFEIFITDLVLLMNVVTHGMYTLSILHIILAVGFIILNINHFDKFKTNKSQNYLLLKVIFLLLIFTLVGFIEIRGLMA